MIDGHQAGSGQAHRQHRTEHHEWELEAALAVEEAFGPVHGRDRHQHGADPQQRPRRPEQAQRDQQPAGELGQPRDPGPGARRLDAHRAQPLRETLDARATEPAQHLLGTVRGERQSDDDAQDEQRDVHDSNLPPTG